MIIITEAENRDVVLGAGTANPQGARVVMIALMMPGATMIAANITGVVVITVMIAVVTMMMARRIVGDRAQGIGMITGDSLEIGECLTVLGRRRPILNLPPPTFYEILIHQQDQMSNLMCLIFRRRLLCLRYNHHLLGSRTRLNRILAAATFRAGATAAADIECSARPIKITPAAAAGLLGSHHAAAVAGTIAAGSIPVFAAAEIDRLSVGAAEGGTTIRVTAHLSTMHSATIPRTQSSLRIVL